MNQIEHRALTAYFRQANRELRQSGNAGTVVQPSVQTIEHAGLTYIRMSNVNGTLAVYRVRTMSGGDLKLKALKRWPAEVSK